MAYLALYRKWRPSTFTEVIGQKHIAIPLERALSENRLAHAYLFSGPRGTGKTSMARILAKAVNCLEPDRVNPCNHCQNCESINHGSSLDVYEIDAASNRGIDDIRSLRESVMALPSTSKYKVYIIDEVHMLSKEAFNALLKTLEEPPAHVVFILATTDPQKIPTTILSRCQSYEFHRISIKDISNHLLYVAKETGFNLDKEAANLIAVKAEGGLRDALSILDKCISSTNKKSISSDFIYNILGLTQKDALITMANHIFSHEKGKVLTTFYKLLDEGKDSLSILSGLLSYFRDLMICKINPESETLIAYGKSLPTIIKTATDLDDAYLDWLFNELEHIYAEVKNSASTRITLEIGLLRLSRYDANLTLQQLEKRISDLENKLISGNDSFISNKKAPVSSIPPKVSIDISLNTTKKKRIEKKLPSNKALHTASIKTKEKESTPASISTTPSQDKTILPPTSYDKMWKDILSCIMSIPRIDVFTCFQKGKLIYVGGARAVISVPQKFLVLAGNNKSYQKVISDAFQKVTGTAYTPKTVLAGTTEEDEVLSLLNKADSDSMTEEIKESSQDSYKKIEISDIPEKDRNADVLAEALKLMPDCDIYEKIE